MTWPYSFEERWQRYTEVSFTDPERRPPVSLLEGYRLCPYARSFLEWAEELVTQAMSKRDTVGVNQAKLRLLDKYFDWRTEVPQAHRNRTGSYNGHVCIFHVFEEAYRVLRVAELSLTPSPLYIPAPRPPREVIYTPLILGERDDGEED